MDNFYEELAQIKQEYAKGEHRKKLDFLLNTLRSQPFVIYGSGHLGQIIYQYLLKQGIKAEAFCDTFRSGIDKTTGVPLIVPEALNASYTNRIVVMGTSNYNAYYYDQICARLKEIGFQGTVVTPEQLLLPVYFLEAIQDADNPLPHVERYGEMWNFLADDTSKRVLLDRIRHLLLWEAMPHEPYANQYFEPGIIHLTESEVFVDCGFYTGDTAETFIRQTKGRYQHIYGFEPDSINIEKCNLDRDKISLIQQGVWSEETILRFTTSTSFGTMSAVGDIEIPVTSLDSFFVNKQDIPTFIKMDIEGSEKQALLGAAHIIKKHKPKLALCVYHKLEDLYELPRIIKDLRPDYQFYLRHYSDCYVETVLYAI
ncbi:FkbM family methyltransferase [Anaerospora hongkongensis]|uniref:FkbM family methyltransferase n=1 Tax=Anaerospora hongkongensis TaxID=244830 RepID=A0A4R1PZC4_9FIRM|nr:FkbM family methyltransferase [Anaerospora hongkongensis]TCL36126.1 FkbM family methyltransferase [Anaerospora hongkongensis]